MFIVEKKPMSMAAESYRTLRTNIEYSAFNESLKTIVVTSSEPGEGKTTTAGNLALSLAQNEKKVLLMDCDLRRGSIHKRFVISNGMGVSEVIVGKASIDSVIRNISKNLDVITTGNLPPNPSEMLGSKNMKSLIKQLRPVYDYIIFDTPPVLAVTDAQILSTKVDGTILVVKAKKTKKDNVINAKKLLDKVKANVIGTVFNGVEESKNNYFHYHENENKKHKKSKKKKVMSLGKALG